MCGVCERMFWSGATGCKQFESGLPELLGDGDFVNLTQLAKATLSTHLKESVQHLILPHLSTLSIQE